jgi:molybdopterin converting factor small subunit
VREWNKQVTVRVRLFGHFSDFWEGEREVQIAENATVGDVADKVASLDQRHSAVPRICRAAVREEYVPFSFILTDNDLVVFIPPMSGG